MNLDSLAGLLRILWNLARHAGLVFVVLAAWFLGREVVTIYLACAAVGWWLGALFLVAFAAAAWWLLLRPVWSYLQVPAAVRPPDLPPLRGAEPLRGDQLLARAAGVGRYLMNLAGNPRLAAAREAIDQAAADCHRLGETLPADPARGREVLLAFERDRVEPLLQPLDDEARRLIRNEALAVAMGTALSPSGAADAFFVLWRNTNLVVKLAWLYYGRPGLRGNLLVLRDVSFAVLVASQMQGLAHAGAQAAGGFLGKAASPLAGPVADGLVNGLVTLRIGYVAMARCRAFTAFNEASVKRVLEVAFQEAVRHGAGLATDLVKNVGIPILKLPVDAARRFLDWATGFFRPEPRAGEGPARPTA